MVILIEKAGTAEILRFKIELTVIPEELEYNEEFLIL